MRGRRVQLWPTFGEFEGNVATPQKVWGESSIRASTFVRSIPGWYEHKSGSGWEFLSRAWHAGRFASDVAAWSANEDDDACTCICTCHSSVLVIQVYLYSYCYVYIYIYICILVSVCVLHLYSLLDLHLHVYFYLFLYLFWYLYFCDFF